MTLASTASMASFPLNPRQYDKTTMVTAEKQWAYSDNSIKGQLILKRIFEVVNFLQKTNENKFTWGLIVVKLNSFVCFLEEIDDPKNHFEINWPLVSKYVRYWSKYTALHSTSWKFPTNVLWLLIS